MLQAHPNRIGTAQDPLRMRFSLNDGEETAAARSSTLKWITISYKLEQMNDDKQGVLRSLNGICVYYIFIDGPISGGTFLFAQKWSNYLNPTGGINDFVEVSADDIRLSICTDPQESATKIWL